MRGAHAPLQLGPSAYRPCKLVREDVAVSHSGHHLRVATPPQLRRSGEADYGKGPPGLWRIVMLARRGRPI